MKVIDKISEIPRHTFSELCIGDAFKFEMEDALCIKVNQSSYLLYASNTKTWHFTDKGVFSISHSRVIKLNATLQVEN